MKLRAVDISGSDYRDLTIQENRKLVFSRDGYCKIDGKRLVDVEIDLGDEKRLGELLCGWYIVTGHDFGGKERNQDNWVGCDTIIIDMDGVPLEKGRAWLEELGCTYIVRYSSRHGLKGEEDRWHVFLPLDRRIDDVADFDCVESWMVKVTGNELDGQCKERARVFYPGSARYAPIVVDKGVLLDSRMIIEEGRAWRIAIKNVGRGKAIRKGEVAYLDLDEEVETKDFGIVTYRYLLERINAGEGGKNGFECVCSFCGYDSERGSPGELNAHFFIPRNGKNAGVPALQCSSCNDRGKGSGGAGYYNIAEEDLRGKAEADGGFFFFYDKRTGGLLHSYVSKKTGCRVYAPADKGLIKNTYRLLGAGDGPDVFPMYELIMDFGGDYLVDKHLGLVNRYVAPQWLRRDWDGSGVAGSDCGLIRGLIWWVMGCDNEGVERFLDWLAWMVQKREKNVTAWVFGGTEGTGKNLLLDNVLGPLFGSEWCLVQHQDRLLSGFNGLMESSVLMVVDEAEMDMTDKNKRGKLEALLKMYIGGSEKTVIERKGVDADKKDVGCSLLFFTNKHSCVRLGKNDRRFNVARRQETKLIDGDWFGGLGLGLDDLKDKLQEQVGDFAWMLRGRVMGSDVKQVWHNDARRAVLEAGMSETETFFNRLLAGDVEWMKDNVRGSGSFNIKRIESREIADGTLRWTKGFEDRLVPKQIVRALYNNICWTGADDISSVAFGKLCVKHGVDFWQRKEDGGRYVVFKP